MCHMIPAAKTFSVEILELHFKWIDQITSLTKEQWLLPAWAQNRKQPIRVLPGSTLPGQGSTLLGYLFIEK